MHRLIWAVIMGGLILVFSPLQAADTIKAEDQLKVYTYTKQFANLFIVQKHDRYLMIDAGLPNDSFGLLSFFEDHHISPTEIDYVILTHAHPDHAGNAAFMQERFKTKIVVGTSDLSMIKAGGYDPELCPRGFQGKLIEKLIAKQRYVPFEPDILISQRISLRELGWEGSIELFKSHTSGSLVVVMKEIAFVGDLIKGKNLNKSKPTFHVFMCSLSQNLKDLESLVQNEEIKTWYLGHMGPLNRHEVLAFINLKREKYE